MMHAISVKNILYNHIDANADIYSHSLDLLTHYHLSKTNSQKKIRVEAKCGLEAVKLETLIFMILFLFSALAGRF